MKATFKSNWKIELDSEAIKAIRFVRGFNTDLRVSLRGINRSALSDWITENEINLFGTQMLNKHPDPTSPDYDKYERMINDVVNQIIR